MFVLVCLSLLSTSWAQVMTGAPVQQHNLQRADLVEMANFVAQSYSSRSNEKYTLGDNVELIGASTQLVSGELYHLTLRVGINNVDQICRVSVWDQPWLNHREITSDTCAKFFPTKRQTGAFHDIQKTKEVQDAAAFAADKINAMSNTMKVKCLVDISSQREQVVAGKIYEMNIVMKTSHFNKGGDVTATKGCTVNGLAQTELCQVKVWDQPWRTPRYEFFDKEFHCTALAS